VRIAGARLPAIDASGYVDVSDLKTHRGQARSYRMLPLPGQTLRVREPQFGSFSRLFFALLLGSLAFYSLIFYSLICSQCFGLFGLFALCFLFFLLLFSQIALTFGKGIVGFGHGQSSRQAISPVILPENDAYPAWYFSRTQRPLSRKGENSDVEAMRQARR